MSRGWTPTDGFVATVNELPLGPDRTRKLSSLRKSARTPASINKKQRNRANGSRGLMSRLEGLSLHDSTEKTVVARARAAIVKKQRNRADRSTYRKQTVVDIHLTTETAPDAKSAAALILAALCANGITEGRVHIPEDVKPSIDFTVLHTILKTFGANPTIVTPNRSKIRCRPWITRKLATQAEWLSCINNSPPGK
jgi:hypothetical protein